MAFQKKELEEVKEQPGTKQKEAPKEKGLSEKKSDKGEAKGKTDYAYEEEGQSRFQHKQGTKSRLKNEAAEYHKTGLDHPAAQYETYKRPRRDS